MTWDPMYVFVGGFALLFASAARAILKTDKAKRDRLAEADEVEFEDAVVPVRRHIPDRRASMAGYDEQSQDYGRSLRVEGWTVQRGERSYWGNGPSEKGDFPVLRRVSIGFVAISAADLPLKSSKPWRMPPASDDQAAARLVRALWTNLSVHLDDYVEISVSEDEDSEPEEILHAARRLVAGVRALTSSPQNLLRWLADPGPDNVKATDQARHRRASVAWRAELLLTWFDDQPLTREVAQREREAVEPGLKVRAALVLGEASWLLRLSQDHLVPEPLQKMAWARGMEGAVLAGDFEAVGAAMFDMERVRRWPDLVVAPLLASQAPEARILAHRLLILLIAHPRFGATLLDHVLDLDPPEAVLLDALRLGQQQTRSRIVRWATEARGKAEALRLCLATLNRNLGDSGHIEPSFEDEDAACWLLTTVGEHGSANEVSALQPWTGAVTPEGKAARLLRETAAEAIRIITERLPAGLVGGLSMVEAEAGALSVAQSPEPEKA